VEELDPADLEAVRACYRRVASAHTGPIDSDDESWWPERIIGNLYADETHRVVVARGEDGAVDGYASFLYEKAEGDLDVSFALACKHFVWATVDALRSLLGYFRGFRGIGQALTFTGPPADPLAMVVEEQRVKPEWTFAWMLRLLDVPGALEARGYPSVSGEALLAVDDPSFADNRGPFRIEADGGKVAVTTAEGADALTMSIGTLSSMFSGYLHPRNAVRLGLLAADDALVDLLARLFAGEAPWMYEFF
jgi:predicted acetyltransferase